MAAEVVVFVEVPMGSRSKYELDAGLGGVVLDRRLPGELRNAVEHFFQGKDLEEAKVETFGYGNRADAEGVVAEARERAP